jgi:hypothetical protein
LIFNRSFGYGLTFLKKYKNKILNFLKVHGSKIKHNFFRYFEKKNVKLRFEIVLRKKSQNVKISKSQAVTSRESIFESDCNKITSTNKLTLHFLDRIVYPT